MVEIFLKKHNENNLRYFYGTDSRRRKNILIFVCDLILNVKTFECFEFNTFSYRERNLQIKGITDNCKSMKEAL